MRSRHAVERAARRKAPRNFRAVANARNAAGSGGLRARRRYSADDIAFAAATAHCLGLQYVFASGGRKFEATSALIPARNFQPELLMRSQRVRGGRAAPAIRAINNAPPPRLEFL